MTKLIRKSRLKGQPPGTLLYQGSHKNGDVRITIFDYDEKDLVEKTAASVEECVPFKDKPTVTWINVDGIHNTEILEKFNACYLVHHLVLEDILDINQRPKADDFGEYIFIVAKMLIYDEAKDDIIEEQVSFILGKNFLITFQEAKAGDVFDSIRERIRGNKGKIRKMGPDYLAYVLLDAIVDNYFVILEKIGEKIETIEAQVVARPTPKTLHAINKLKRELIFLRKVIWPMREVANISSRMESGLIRDTVKVYYHDIYDQTMHAIDTVEAFRDSVSGILDIYLSSVSYRLNEVMKVLTVIATIFMPLTFIAGIYGMNFNTGASKINMPELNWPFGYFMVLLFMLTVAVSMLVYFKRKKWF